MDTKVVLTLSVTILLALIGYLATYLNNLRLAQRRDRLERVNRQLKELYGPLFALVSTSDSAWHAFRTKWRPSGSFWGTQPPVTIDEAEAWRLWMSVVFIPLHQKMEKIIMENADLLEEPEMPKCLLALLAHMSSYKAVLSRWESGDFSDHLSAVKYPRVELLNYTKSSFTELKARQAKLLGKPRDGVAVPGNAR